MNTLYTKLKELMLSLNGFRREVVVVCMGTDSVLGDCLGPTVGQMLMELNTKCYVYGTLSNPITALNANDYSRFVAARHPHAIVIAVDSCVGLARDVGKVRISRGKLCPGAALNKNLLSLGDICLMAVVSDCLPNQIGFSHVRLGLVYSLARFVALSINNCVCLFNYTIKTGQAQSLTPVFSIRI